MPDPIASLSIDDVRRLVAERSFESNPDRVGLEAEWLVMAGTNPAAPVPFEMARTVAEAAARPAGSRLTFEPGGQIELSSDPKADLAGACNAVAVDSRAIREALDAHGLSMVGVGLDPLRPPRRVLRQPRYEAMEAYFDGDGPRGRTMMCSTAAVQVNLDFGPGATGARRWHLAHLFGPALAAAFANSPLEAGKPSGWASTRMATWLSLDPSRTAPVADGRAPAEAWADYVLSARVMMVEAGPNHYAHVSERLAFADWITRGHELGFPTKADLDYHMTTLFPPVRPRGWLELRSADSLPEPWWRVPAAVWTALLYGDGADRAERDAGATAGMWREAARDGLRHPALASAAMSCFAAALDALPALCPNGHILDLVAAFADRYPARGRCPADDRLKEWTATGAVVPREARAA